MAMKKHLIMYQYSQWLEKFCKTNPPKKSYKQAQLILQDLQQISDIATLIDLVERYIPSESHAFQKETIPAYEPINFYCQLMQWRNDLLERKTMFELAKQTLQQTTTTPKIGPLIDLLKDMLHAHEGILHTDLKSMLHFICDPTFMMVLGYIEQQHEAPQPTNPRKGSFAAETPLNNDHQHCLALLNYVADTYHQNNHNPLWEKANGLLQTALRLYADMTFFEVDLNEKTAQERPIRWCVFV
jgi:hypothetical protein